MKLGERVSYLKGLMEGLDVGESTKEGKVIALMADILEDMAVGIEDLQDQVDEVVEVVDCLDEDLGEVEKDFYEIDDEDDSCNCGCHHDDDEDEEYDDEYDDDDFDDDDVYEVTCPSCGDTICLNESMLEEGSINCPNCHELLEFDFEDEDDSEDEAPTEE